MVHQWKSQVRDYESDLYGGVNAATYINYMEEARKWFLAHYGFNLKEMFDRNLGFIVTRYEIDYKASLVAGDEFVVETTMERISRIQVEFTQHVYSLPGRKLVVTSKNLGIPIAVSTNRPVWPAELDEKLAAFPIRGKA